MSNMKNKTLQSYRRIVRQVSKHTGKPAKSLTHADFAAFVEARAIADYAPQSLNLYRAAANYYLAAVGSSDRLPLVSARNWAKLPERILSPGEVDRLLAALNPFYRGIAERIYHGPRQPKDVLANTSASRGGTVAAKTLAAKFAAATKDWPNRATPYALFVSGIIHALQRGVDRDELAESTGLAPVTLAKYAKLAGLPVYQPPDEI